MQSRTYIKILKHVEIENSSKKTKFLLRSYSIMASRRRKGIWMESLSLPNKEDIKTRVMVLPVCRDINDDDHDGGGISGEFWFVAILARQTQRYESAFIKCDCIEKM